MHCSQAFSSGSVKGVVIVDVSYDAVLELLQELNFGGGILVSFVTADGRMISVNNPVDSGLIDTAESSSYVKVDGRRYYYMSAESSVTGGKIVVMVPIEYITAGTKEIRDITIAMIVAACIAAMLIATVITAGITGNIRKSIGRLDRVAKRRSYGTGKRETEKRWGVWKTFRGIISYHYENEIPDHDGGGNEKRSPAVRGMCHGDKRQSQ